MSTTSIPKTATVDKAALAGRTLARAFGDDPMTRWFLPDDPSREAALGRYLTTLSTRRYARHGVCERTDAAAAFWVPPQAQAVPDAETEEFRLPGGGPVLWAVRREPHSPAGVRGR
ncbi:hypothetical protein [Streptomyces sp. NPDC000351]|uniref:hypothetical protein n=1 Tax=Streptomyces sp. NPDC000351 TaxID=3154250 RepID=UPI0033331B0C